MIKGRCGLALSGTASSEGGRWAAAESEGSGRGVWARTVPCCPSRDESGQLQERPVVFLIGFAPVDVLIGAAAVYMRNEHCSSIGVATLVEVAGVKDRKEITSGRSRRLTCHLVFRRSHAGHQGILCLLGFAKPLYPVELSPMLVTGMLVFLFESKDRSGPIESPALYVRYRAPRDTFLQ